jgi:ATP-binding cassette subfamily B (MDR/TAP) protein 1
MVQALTDKPCGVPDLQIQEPDQTTLRIVDIEKTDALSTAANSGNNTEGPKKISSKSKKEDNSDDPKVSYLQLYRFADTWDWICEL